MLGTELRSSAETARALGLTNPNELGAKNSRRLMKNEDLEIRVNSKPFETTNKK